MSVKNLIKQSKFWRFRVAKRLANSSKRLDLCAAQVAHLFHLAGHPVIKNQTCLEIGSGWVLSHALVLHLLGAKKVIATDILPEAQPAVLKNAVAGSVDSIVRDILSPFCDHEELRERMERLRHWSDYSFEGLSQLGIEYRAPIDLLDQKLDSKVDFVYSNSVLEHVSIQNVERLLENLISMVTPRGVLIHAIHLEDHQNHHKEPFEFLNLPASEYPESQQLSRGNRLRASSWKNFFQSLPQSNSDVLFEWKRSEKLLPSYIDTSVSHVSIDDARTSHIAFKTTVL